MEGKFHPRINEVSKKLRRDMPVVERLLMLEQVAEEDVVYSCKIFYCDSMQVKQEKIERLKKDKEQVG